MRGSHRRWRYLLVRLLYKTDALHPTPHHLLRRSLPQGGSLFVVISFKRVILSEENVTVCDVFVVEPDHREGAKRDLIMKMLSFLPRSRMSFHSIRSSRCSDFDYAQDDTAKFFVQSDTKI